MIEFRGKHIITNEYVYGYFYLDKFKIAWILNDDEKYQIDFNTLGQYINKTDKNGVKIYTGSKVKFMYKNPNYNPKKPKAKMEWIYCDIVLSDDGLYTLKWSDGYINSAPLNCKKYEVVE